MISFSYPLVSAPAPPITGGTIATIAESDSVAVFSISDLALDPETWDLVLPPKLIYGAEAVLQRIRVRFRWFRGEWFLDTREGVPYFESILIKNPDKNLIDFIFRRVLTLTPGVKSVESFSSVFDKAERSLSASFVANLIDSGTITAESEPFIVV